MPKNNPPDIEAQIYLEPEAVRILLDKIILNAASADALAELLLCVKEAHETEPKTAPIFVEQLIHTIFFRYSPASRDCVESYLRRLRGEDTSIAA